MAIRQPLDVQTQATSEPTVSAEVDQDNDALGPPGGDQETSTETPASAGVSAFIDEEEFLVAIAPGVGRALRKFVFSSPPPSNAKSAITITEKTVPKKSTVEQVDPAILTPEEIQFRADKEATILHDSDLASFDTTQTHHVNMDTIHTNDQAKAVLGQMAESFSGEIDAARGGVLHDQQLQVFAKELGVDPKFIQSFLVKEFGEGVNASQILAARSILESSAQQLKDLAWKIHRGEAGSRDKVEFLNQFDFHRQWMAQFMGARAELGRGMRALQVNSPAGIPGKPPEVPNSRLEEVVAHWGTQMDINKVADQILANDTMLGVNQTVKAQPGGMNPYGSAFIEHFVGSLLSGIKTQVVNITGNALMTVKGPVEVAIAARLGRKLPSDADRVIAGEATAMLFGMQNGLRDALGAAWTAGKTGEPYGGSAKFELGHNKAISSEALGLHGVAGWMADAYGAVARAPMERLLGPMDAFFKVINERAAFAQLSYREAMRQAQKEGLDNVQTLERLNAIMENPEAHAPGMMQEVIDYGLYTTFQNPLGPSGRALQNAVNTHASLKMFAPFIRTPINIFKVGFGEMTPLGLLSTKYKNALKSATSGNPAQAQIMRARMMMGSTIMTIFAGYAIAGKITGSGPKDADERATLMATGWRPRSIRVDKEDGTVAYVPYGRFEPLSLPLGAVADVVEVLQTHQWDDLDSDTQDHLSKTLGAITFAITENTINKTYMQGVNSAMKAVEDYERYGGRWITSTANALLPLSGMRRDVRKLNDEYVREALTLVDKFKAMNPYFSEGLPKKLDIWGEPIKYEVFLNPHSILTTQPDDVDIEIRRLLQMTGETPVTRPGKKLGGAIDLTAEQYHDMIFFSRKGILLDAAGRVLMPGQTPQHDGPWYSFKDYLGNALFQSESYLSATDFGKVKLIKEIREGLDQDAKEALLESYPDLHEAYLMYSEVNPARRELGDDAARKLLQGTDLPVNF